VKLDGGSSAMQHQVVANSAGLAGLMERASALDVLDCGGKSDATPLWDHDKKRCDRIVYCREGQDIK
jgi:hypothetical protein